MTGLICPMLSYQVRDTEIDVVRHQLNNLADLRYRTGLSASEEARYRDLGARERTLLGSTVGSHSLKHPALAPHPTGTVCGPPAHILSGVDAL